MAVTLYVGVIFSILSDNEIVLLMPISVIFTAANVSYTVAAILKFSSNVTLQ